VKKPTIAALLLAVASFAVTWAASAHHSFAMFDASEHQLVEGRVTEWAYNSPHSWLHIEYEDANGELQKWSFEGAAPIHAARQGVTGNTFRKGEFIRVVMHPLRDGRQAGAICFVVKQDGSIVRPNDGICNSAKVSDTWEANGWLDSTANLGKHPSPESRQR
jgi:hypothetical protein